MYLALAGGVASVAAVLARWRRTTRGARLAPVVMALVTAGLVAASFVRVDDFVSVEKLWRATLAVNPAAYAAHNDLGLICQRSGRFAEAEIHYRAALKVHPGILLAGSNLVALYQQTRRWREAEAVYAWLLAQRPNAKELNNDGSVWMELGDGLRARARFQQATALDPELVSPHANSPDWPWRRQIT